MTDQVQNEVQTPQAEQAQKQGKSPYSSLDPKSGLVPFLNSMVAGFKAGEMDLFENRFDGKPHQVCERVFGFPAGTEVMVRNRKKNGSYEPAENIKLDRAFTLGLQLERVQTSGGSFSLRMNVIVDNEFMKGFGVSQWEEQKFVDRRDAFATGSEGGTQYQVFRAQSQGSRNAKTASTEQPDPQADVVNFGNADQQPDSGKKSGKKSAGEDLKK